MANATIVALATAPGRGGIGIIRLSGAKVPQIAVDLLGRLPQPRLAELCQFRAADGSVIDYGIVLYFVSPHSYTGEPVLELQGHGSPVVAQMLIARCIELGASMARPGEFSERAFLGGQLDLAQAEAVADLIASNTVAAARSAQNALQGAFSKQVHALTDSLTKLRILVEAAIDFADEEIDFLSDQQTSAQLTALRQQFADLRASMRQGKLLRDGLRVVLTGATNVGKSSLLNRLSREQRAIVSAIAGTTRDTLEQQLDIDGLPVVLIDTAGLRESNDSIEIEGVRRARLAWAQADLLLWVIDASSPEPRSIFASDAPPAHLPVLKVYNKIDLCADSADSIAAAAPDAVYLSARTGAGIDKLYQRLKEAAGFRQIDDSQFIARQRHIDALDRAGRHVDAGIDQMRQYQAAEILAEELLLAQNALGEITGEVSSDDLLGFIFSTFCIGK